MAVKRSSKMLIMRGLPATALCLLAPLGYGVICHSPSFPVEESRGELLKPPTKSNMLEMIDKKVCFWYH